jgi:hypothetical protein
MTANLPEWGAEGAILAEAPAAGTGDVDPHVVTYFDWAHQRVRQLGPVFGSKTAADAYAAGLPDGAFDGVQTIPEAQVPEGERRGGQ